MFRFGSKRVPTVLGRWRFEEGVFGNPSREALGNWEVVTVDIPESDEPDCILEGYQDAQEKILRSDCFVLVGYHGTRSRTCLCQLPGHNVEVAWA